MVSLKSIMKIYVENFLPDSAISRISSAIKKYIPPEHKLVGGNEDADFVIVIAYGHRRYMQRYSQNLLAHGKRYAVIQLSVRSTSNPNTLDWIPIWEKAQFVWSYYDLPELCKEDQVPVNFNFYLAPLGVNSRVFKETKSERDFLIASTGSGRPWNKECKNAILLAAKGLGKKIFQLGPGQDSDTITYSNNMDDATLARYYSRCEFVSGMRRIEGFELPVIEGLLCGARPICFDRPGYRHWFGKFAEFIPEDANIPENIRKVFMKGAKPVTEAEKEYVKTHFDWEKIMEDFWKKWTP